MGNAQNNGQGAGLHSGIIRNGKAFPNEQGGNAEIWSESCRPSTGQEVGYSKYDGLPTTTQQGSHIENAERAEKRTLGTEQSSGTDQSRNSGYVCQSKAISHTPSYGFRRIQFGGFQSQTERSSQVAYACLTGLQGFKLAGAFATGIGEPQSPRSISECYYDLWPAGPDEPQYPWEEPRTIGNQYRLPATLRKLWSTLRPLATKMLGEEAWLQIDHRIHAATQSSLGSTVNGYNFREDLLRAYGNGVVEQTAELAFTDLMRKHGLSHLIK